MGFIGQVWGHMVGPPEHHVPIGVFGPRVFLRGLGTKHVAEACECYGLLFLQQRNQRV